MQRALLCSTYKVFLVCRMQVVAPLTSSSATLPLDAFKASKKTRTLPFQSIVTTTQKAPYPSTQTENMHRRLVDCVVLRKEVPKYGHDVIDDLWLGQLVDVSHKMVLGVRANPLANFEYYFGLG